jgi:hypothetical protein
MMIDFDANDLFRCSGEHGKIDIPLFINYPPILNGFVNNNYHKCIPITSKH